MPVTDAATGVQHEPQCKIDTWVEFCTCPAKVEIRRIIRERRHAVVRSEPVTSPGIPQARLVPKEPPPLPRSASPVTPRLAGVSYWAGQRPARCIFCARPFEKCIPRPGSHHEYLRNWQARLSIRLSAPYVTLGSGFKLHKAS